MLKVISFMWFAWCLIAWPVLALSAPGAGTKTDKLVVSPQSSAPSCPSGQACIYHLSSDSQLYAVDGAGVTTKVNGAKSFRTSMNCAGLSGPANGDVCFDTTLGYFRFYSGGWITVALSYSAPLSLSGQTLSLAAGGIVYATVSGGGAGVLGVATLYLRSLGQAATGTTETDLLVAPRAGTVRNLRCFLKIAPGGADTVINTVRVNAAGIVTTCTISGAATSCADTTNTSAVAAGDRISIESVSSAGTASDLSCAFEVTN